jgi:hypothetical protein
VGKSVEESEKGAFGASWKSFLGIVLYNSLRLECAPNKFVDNIVLLCIISTTVELIFVEN